MAFLGGISILFYACISSHRLSNMLEAIHTRLHLFRTTQLYHYINLSLGITSIACCFCWAYLVCRRRRGSNRPPIELLSWGPCRDRTGVLPAVIFLTSDDGINSLPNRALVKNTRELLSIISKCWPQDLESQPGSYGGHCIEQSARWHPTPTLYVSAETLSPERQAVS